MAINWFTLFAQLINFVILLFLLRRFLYGPIMNVIAERDAQIAANMQNAEALAKEAQEDAKRHQTALDALDDERDALMAEAVNAANMRRSEMIDEARSEVEGLRSDWYSAVEHEKQRFLMKVRARMGETIHNVARDALADLANEELEEAIVAEFLKKIQDYEEMPLTDNHRESPLPDEIVVRSTYKLGAEQQEQIRDAVAKAVLGEDGDDDDGDDYDHDANVPISFIQSSELICGIEAQFSHRRIAWNLRDYLDSYAAELDSVLVADMDIQDRGVSVDALSS